jgi:hypothetical protein
LGTLLGRDDQPGEIAGWGPVPASVARTLTARARTGEWRYAILDGDGRLLFDGTTRHRPHLAPDTGAGAPPDAGVPDAGAPPGEDARGEGARGRGDS